MLSLCWLLVAAAAIDLERSVSIAGRNATGTCKPAKCASK